MATSQENRMCRVYPKKAKDALLIERMVGRESISSPFVYQLDLLSESGDLVFDDIVGESLAISMRLQNDEVRWFHGVVARLEQGGSRVQQGTEQELMFAYRAEVVPTLWFAGRRSNCRIFQNQSVPEIARTLFKELELTDYKLELPEYPKREYCVQYRETDLQFLSRLLEDEGIAYYFEHSEKAHTLVLFDNPARTAKCVPSEAIYKTASDQGAPSGDIANLYFGREVRPAARAATDFDFENPSMSLLSEITSSECIGSRPELQIYDYPGNFLTVSDGKSHVRRRIEAEECASFGARADSHCPGLTSGHRFTLKGHYRKDYNRSYLVTTVLHTLIESVGGGSSTDPAMYRNSFTCTPDEMPYRPLPRTPRPVIHGAQTATVVGGSGKEIDVDKHGRVVVQFHWDREGKRNEVSSCRVRVAQNWAGKGWGLIAHPRIGQEVLVEFLEGDPDRPIVTGRVYNGEQVLPYPDNHTQTGIKSRSSPGGSPSNFNELRFEDDKGKEQIFLQAEKNLDVKIKNDESREIEQNQTILLVQGNRSITLQKGDDRLEVSKGDILVTAPAGQHLTDAIDIVVDGKSSIRLRCGASSIELTPAMIKINAPLVKIN